MVLFHRAGLSIFGDRAKVSGINHSHQEGIHAFRPFFVDADRGSDHGASDESGTGGKSDIEHCVLVVFGIHRCTGLPRGV